ncbi:type IV pilus biogenesis/stability protein PilW [Lysobacter enzymogenes]|uniref:type IV pilus biogenesis/stability protein PilW n=1 Tax=Lysobacter enzymogenes TaxID=69 RepID=UPI001A973273|nr:type IV pilus biogenesis/stability protein PilW [Lysobacter enzymogenes]QQP97489.1 type IV pilus biogenesis/stability protein PilW [Lysobacter enzymogenes]
MPLDRSPGALRGRLLRGLMLSALVLVGAAACNRLTFIKPNLERKGYDETGPSYELKKSRQAPSGAAAANARVLAAQRYLQAGEDAKAREELRQALKLDAKSVEAYSVMAVMAERDGKTAEAGGYYRKAAELAPLRGAVLNNYAVWLCANGQPAQALGYFDNARLDPDYTDQAVLLSNSGACADRAGQGERAERDLRQALAFDPVNATALGAMAKRQLRIGKAFEARAFSERRLAVEPISAEALMTASQIEEKLGDRAAAARYVQRMRAEFPDAQGSESGDGGK